MSTNYHSPIPAAPAQPEATSELFNNRFSELDAGISGKLDPAGDGSNLKNTFSQAAERTNVVSGEKLATSLGKIRKWFVDLMPVAFTGSYSDLNDKPAVMTPSAHATSHANGGTDAVTPTAIGALAVNGSGSDLTNTITTATVLVDLTSGETLGASLGKLSKWFNGLVAARVKAGTNVTLQTDADGNVTINAAGGGSSGGSAHVIADQGSALPQQGTLDFRGGLAAADDAAAFKTVAKLADMPAKTIKGNKQATSGAAVDLTVAEVQELILPATMTPSAHAASHAAGGADSLTLTKAQISDFPVFEDTIANIKPLAAVASAGTLNTVARADHVHAVNINLIYPVGSIYMSVNSANPSTLFGGTWVAWGQGRVPVGIDPTDSDFDTVGETGGAKTHQLTIDEMPSHRHTIGYNTSTGSYEYQATAAANPQYQKPTSCAGGSQSHNNLQPYIVCYMWVRTA